MEPSETDLSLPAEEGLCLLETRQNPLVTKHVLSLLRTKARQNAESVEKGMVTQGITGICFCHM